MVGVIDRVQYVRELSQLEGFLPFDSDANFMLLRYPLAIKKDLQDGLKQRYISIKFLDDPGLQDCIRITLGTQEQNKRVVEAFKDIAEALHVGVQARAVKG